MTRADWLPPPPDETIPGLSAFLAIETWAERDMPAPDRLLGDLMTTTSRTFLVGRTGLGKTLLAQALACGAASGKGFLHWRAGRPARVLIIDGEMPGELLRQRARDTLRRAGIAPPPGNLMIYARDIEEEFAKRFPTLGLMPPLNTEAGHNWTMALITALGGVDAVIFDNVMSLLDGIQKEEEAWRGAIPLVLHLTSKRIAQVWLDHTGHAGDRQYGSSTKAWHFDSVGIMTPVADDQQQRGEVAFTLSFDHPGKARRRTPDNCADFAACVIRLAADKWTASPMHTAARGTGAGKVRPARMPFYDALVAAIGKAPTAPDRTLVTTWELECLRRGLIEPPPAPEVKESWQQRSARHVAFRKAKSDLLAAGWIAIEDETVIDLHGRWT